MQQLAGGGLTTIVLAELTLAPMAINSISAILILMFLPKRLLMFLECFFFNNQTLLPHDKKIIQFLSKNKTVLWGFGVLGFG